MSGPFEARQRHRPRRPAFAHKSCATTEEDSALYGLISLTSSALPPLASDAAKFRADQLDDYVQDALDKVSKDCPRIVTLNPARRLSGAVIADIRNAALRRLEESKHPVQSAAASPLDRIEAAELKEERKLQRRASGPLGKATAADLSQELTSWEIDAWLDGLPPLQRTMALFEYASDVTPKDVAEALGVTEPTLKRDALGARARLLSYIHEDDDNALAPSSRKPMEYRIAGMPIGGLMQPLPAPGVPRPSLRITGISTDLYAGWSLLATVVGLPSDKGLDLAGPMMVATDGTGERRMIVTAVASSKSPNPTTRPAGSCSRPTRSTATAAGPGITTHCISSPARSTTRKR